MTTISNRIQAELAALGEPEAQTQELEVSDGDGDLDPDIALVCALFSLGEHDGHDGHDGLDELGSRRVWRAIESRRARISDRESERHPVQTSRRISGVTVAVLVAVAAALVLIPVFSTSQDARMSPTELQSLGAQARAGLEILGVAPGHELEDAEIMSRGYEIRLRRATEISGGRG